jgi:hypothetical protein
MTGLPHGELRACFTVLVAFKSAYASLRFHYTYTARDYARGGTMPLSNGNRYSRMVCIDGIGKL